MQKYLTNLDLLPIMILITFLVAIFHKEFKGILDTLPVDKLTIASDIKNGLWYITIFFENKS